MVYVLVLFVFYTGKPVERLTVIHPTEWLCNAHMAGIQAKIGEDGAMLKAQGMEKAVMKCVPFKEA